MKTIINTGANALSYVIETIRVELTASHCPADGLTFEYIIRLSSTLVVSVVELLHILLITLRVGAAIPTP